MAVVDIVIPTYRGIAQEATRSSNRDDAGEPTARNAARTGKSSTNLGSVLTESTACVRCRKSIRVRWFTGRGISPLAIGTVRPARGTGDRLQDYFFLMDDDMTCQNHFLGRLMSYKKDIVCGICTVRNDPPKPNIRLWNKERQLFYYPVEWDWDSQEAFGDRRRWGSSLCSSSDDGVRNA